MELSSCKVPAFRCIYAKVEGDYAETLRAGLKTLEENGWTLAGAVQEYTCPRENGQLYLLFPVERL